MWGRLTTCAAVDYRRRSAANAAVDRLTIGRSLPSPTRSQPVCNTAVLTPQDPLSIAASTAILLAITALAGYIPARRATRIDPMIALRS
jgi:ABC-type lipoprotein release transport system permease subunit